MATEIHTAVEELGRNWDQFKEVNDQRLAEIEKRGEATTETLLKLERVEGAMDLAAENRKRIEQIEADAKTFQKAENKADDEDKKHRDLFFRYLANPFDSDLRQELKAMEKAIYAAQKEAREMEGKAVTLTTTGGGHAIPTIVGGIIATKIMDMSPMRSLARVVSSDNELTRWLVSDNNSTSNWVAAGAARTATTESLLQSVVPTYGTAYGLTTVYEEALNDLIINVPGWLEDDISSRLAAAEGTAFISGDASAKPTGITNGTPVATGDEASPQRAFGVLEYAATGIAADFQGDRVSSPPGNPGDVFLTCLYSLKKAYRRNARWLMNSTVLSAVRKFKDSQGDYLYRPNFQGGMGDLFGFEVVEDENVADVGANTFPVIFGDFTEGYLIADINASMRVTVDDNITSKGNVIFYSRRRLGGIVSNDDAIKLIKCAVT